MRFLIDGYNLMHAVVLSPGRKLGPDGLRKIRHRFLNELSELIGPIEAHQTTVVFDAAIALPHLPRESSHKGMTILFADVGEEADERIEHLIARHSAPRQLTVVSTDHRLRLAAGRRRSNHLTADAYWSGLQDRRDRKPGRPESPRLDALQEHARLHGPDEAEARYWLDQFRDLADSPEIRQVSQHADFVPTDEEIARITREVEDEFRRL